ncbi:FAD:protein FMN transferase [Inhella sp.]|uniref:FAD:protein FMN transferase n=1 Tax=Inhella sp. TaxID=1921806 RepID=UPI0035B005FE
MQVFRHPFQALGGSAEIVLAASDEAEARRLAQIGIDEVLRIEHKYSRYRADSLIGRINAQAGGEPVELDDETLALLRFADTLHQDSDGLFDPTSGVLRRAWNFKQPRLPQPDELVPLVALIGWPRVAREGKSLRLPEAGMELDFGGFGKEYAADRAAAALKAAGVRNGHVNLAGDIRVLGPKPDGKPWQIGIQHPRQPGKLIASLPLHQGGLATSGDYERYFELDGQRYCHVLNPRTGWPVRFWRSVSVVAPLTVAAGALSSLAMLKEQEGLELLQRSGLPFLAIDPDGALLRDALP